jgi:hypothetical protein
MNLLSVVMAGPVPAIHVLSGFNIEDADARDKRGHDDVSGGTTQSVIAIARSA